MTTSTAPVLRVSLPLVALVALFLLAVAARLVFVWLVPQNSGDWILYGDVARNILNGCGVAVSTAEGCVPHFGGNQLPLFPAFAALIWWITGQSETAIRLVQTGIAALAVVWLAHAATRFTGSRLLGLAVGLVQAVSPIQSIWAGALLTETLALVSVQWVLAELLLGHAERRFRIVPVGVAMTFAIWVRLDGVFLAVPVVLSALMLAPPRQAVRACVLAGLIAFASLGAWTVRNLSVGISPVPIYGVLPDGTQGPKGYVSWVRTWVVTEHDRAAALFFGTRSFDRIRIPPSAFASDAEQEQVTALLQQLRLNVGKPFPAEIDAAFLQLAERRVAAQSGVEKVSLILARSYEMARPWVWPPGRKDAFGANAPPSPSDLYRFLVFVGCIIAVGYALKTRQSHVAILLILSLGFAATRFGFFVAVVGIETRYLIQLAPFAETLAAISMGHLMGNLWQRQFRTGVPSTSAKRL
jgi:hypothetical protein